MKISSVIPCYRSEHTIEGVVSEIKSVVSQRPEVDYEIIMVSDHSPDNDAYVVEIAGNRSYRWFEIKGA